jgi:hypothetical protein
VNDTGSLTCNCQPGYKGPRCQMVDHCHNSSCNLRNSRCVSSDVSFTCECFPGQLSLCTAPTSTVYCTCFPHVFYNYRTIPYIHVAYIRGCMYYPMCCICTVPMATAV